MTNSDVYSLTTGKYLESLYAVDNQFIQQLANLSIENAKQLKMVSVILKDKVNNRGEIAKKGVKAADKSVIDLCKVTPLVGLGGAKNMFEELAIYRWYMLKLDEVPGLVFDRLAKTLFVDYLLSACVCYVEVFDPASSRVDKFLATRNRFIAGGLAGMAPEDTSKFINYLTPHSQDYVNKHIRVLKLSHSSTGFKVTQPRSHLDFNKDIKITPLFLLTTFLDGISDIISSNIIKFTYIKDNVTEREMVTTLSPQILLQYYDSTFVQKVLSAVEAKIVRGYVRLPELGISKYDETGVRALNVARVTSIELVQDFDSRFIHVDFNNILGYFKSTVESVADLNVLAFLFEALADDVLKVRKGDIIGAQSAITSFVDAQYAIGTTTFLRRLHILMLQFPNIFRAYNGGKPKEFTGGSNFDLGVEE